MSMLISDPMRSPITVSRGEKDDALILRAPGKTIVLSPTEFERLKQFAAGMGTMQRYVAQ